MEGSRRTFLLCNVQNLGHGGGPINRAGRGGQRRAAKAECHYVLPSAVTISRAPFFEPRSFADSSVCGGPRRHCGCPPRPSLYAGPVGCVRYFVGNNIIGFHERPPQKQEGEKVGLCCPRAQRRLCRPVLPQSLEGLVECSRFLR